MATHETMLAETVLFPGHQGDQISGYLARPMGPGPYPGVIVIHAAPAVTATRHPASTRLRT